GGMWLGLFRVLDRKASVADLAVRDASVDGEYLLGMLAGRNMGHVAGCRADGIVSAVYDAGGLIGSNAGDISDCYVVGEVNAVASSSVGGLTGSNYGSVSRCYAAARVTSIEPVQGYVTGGLVGNVSNSYRLGPPGEIHDSYFLIDTDRGGPDNGFGVSLTDAQMRQQTSFPGFDFETTWTICEGRDYPRLRWEAIDCNRP
ncbi:MAG: GLUG motif-containing protein, partial [Phycisphaerales bacterium]